MNARDGANILAGRGSVIDWQFRRTKKVYHGEARDTAESQQPKMMYSSIDAYLKRRASSLILTGSVASHKLMTGNYHFKKQWRAVTALAGLASDMRHLGGKRHYRA